MKQEYLYYSLGAAVLVIIILAGALVYALGTRSEQAPLAATSGGSGTSAPALDPQQLNSGELPAGHPDITKMMGGSTGTGTGSGTGTKTTSATTPKTAPAKK